MAEATLEFQPCPAPLSLSPAFDELVLSQLDSSFSRERVARGGLNIVTSLDYDLQIQAACAVQAQLRRLAGDDSALPAIDGGPCLAAQDLPPLPPGIASSEESASAAVIDPQTGQLLALVGEIDSTGRPGSLFARRIGTLATPFIYLTGFARGLSPANLAWDIPDGLSGTAEGIQNPDGEYHGPVRLREALACDYLVAAAEILSQLGEESVARIAAPFGISIPESRSDPLLGGAVGEGIRHHVLLALLHDAVEDQGGLDTLQKIERRLGSRVAAIVKACSDALSKPKPPWKERKDAYIASIAEKPRDAVMVSIADKIHNARAILGDYREIGDALWKRFKGDREGTLWYYRALVEAFKPVGPSKPAGPPGLRHAAPTPTPQQKSNAKVQAQKAKQQQRVQPTKAKTRQASRPIKPNKPMTTANDDFMNNMRRGMVQLEEKTIPKPVKESF